MNRPPRRSTTIVSAIVGLVFMSSNLCFGTLVQVDFSGSVDFSDGPNPLGLLVGDTVTGTATYDDVLLTGVGGETIGLGTTGGGFGGTLTMNMGAVTFVESDDVDFSGDIFPTLNFLDGALVAFDFIVEDKPNLGDGFSSDFDGTWFFGFSPEPLVFRTVRGAWDTFSDPVPITGVPEPSTLMLFGIALLGLGWMGRRRTA